MLDGDRGAAGDRGRVWRSRRSFAEFVVDGEALAGRLGDAIERMDLVPVLVRDWVAGFPAEDYQRLVGGASSMPQGGRAALYVCPECGDIGCGAITAVIEHGAETVIWRDFAYQVAFDRLDPGDLLADLDPIVFERAAYLEALAGVRDRWSSDRGV